MREYPESLSESRAQQRLDDALAANASLQKRLQQLAEENEKLRHGSQDTRSQLHHVKEKLSKLQIEFENQADLLTLAKNRGDYLAGVIDNMEKGFWPELELARLENERLKRGDFTEEEFQNLCHHFTEDNACRFKKGCEEYQSKLFGNKGVS